MNVVLSIVSLATIAIFIKACSNVPPGRRRSEISVLTEDRILRGHPVSVEYRFRVTRQCFTVYVTPVPCLAQRVHWQTGELLTGQEPHTLTDAQQLATQWIEMATLRGSGNGHLERSRTVVTATA